MYMSYVRHALHSFKDKVEGIFYRTIPFECIFLNVAKHNGTQYLTRGWKASI